MENNNIVALSNDTSKKYETWQNMRDAGMTLSQIAELFNTTSVTVYRHTKPTELWLAGGKSHTAYVLRTEYYIPYMLKLRKLGYSNRDISGITGFAYNTVLRYIGAQPDETTLASHRVAGAKRHFRNVARKNQPERDAGKPIPAVAKILNPEVA